MAVVTERWMPVPEKAFYDIGAIAVTRLLAQEPRLTDLFARRLSLSDIATALHHHPLEQQSAFFAHIFGPEGVDVPNPKKLAGFLAAANTIEWYSYYRKQSNLAPLSRQVLEGLNLPGMPVRVIQSNWPSDWQSMGRWLDEAELEESSSPYVGKRSHEWDVAWNNVNQALWSAAREQEIAKNPDLPNLRASIVSPEVDAKISLARGLADSIGHRARISLPREILLRQSVANNLIGTTQQAIEYGALWTMVEDYMPQQGYERGNPALPILEISRRGALVIGPVNRQFVVFVPPSPKG